MELATVQTVPGKNTLFDAAGAPSGTFRTAGLIYADTTVRNSDSIAEKKITGFTLPANSLITPGQVLHIVATLKGAADTNDKTPYLILGTVASHQDVITGILTAVSGVVIQMEAWVIVTTSATQKVISRYQEQGAAVFPIVANASLTVDFTAAVEVNISAACEAATSGQITVESWFVEIIGG